MGTRERDPHSFTVSQDFIPSEQLATSNSQPLLVEHDSNNNNNNKVYFSSGRLKDHKPDAISFTETSLCGLSYFKNRN